MMISQCLFLQDSPITDGDMLFTWTLNVNLQLALAVNFFYQKLRILQTLSICKVTAKAVCKFTLKVYVNNLSPSVTLLWACLQKREGGFVKTLHW